MGETKAETTIKTKDEWKMVCVYLKTKRMNEVEKKTILK